MQTEQEIIKHLGQSGQAQQAKPIAQSLPSIFPSTPSEFTTVLAHYYRAEMSRMMSWRDRIDRTTNWAITVVAALLSVSLSTPTAHHGVLLFAMVIVSLLLVIEARRYRFFDVYRSRVRLIERHYFAHLFAPMELQELAARTNWLNQIGEGLRLPRFSVTLNQALSRRLRRNYCWLFFILLLAWLLKTTAATLQPQGGKIAFVHSTAELLDNAAIVGVPGWAVASCILLFYGWLGYVMFKHRTITGELALGEVHV